MFFFFNDTATTEIYTLSLHDALPICCLPRCPASRRWLSSTGPSSSASSLSPASVIRVRSEEHTSELQSRQYLVCRLLLEKKKKKRYMYLLSYSLHRDLCSNRFPNSIQ